MSLYQVQECVTRCQGPSQQANEYVMSELQQFNVSKIHIYTNLGSSI